MSVAQHFTINLPTSLTGFAPNIRFTNRSVGWQEVCADYRQGNEIIVPDFVFSSTRKVDDETAYRFTGNGDFVCERGAPSPGAVVIVLESPHKDEFKGQVGAAIGPLRNDAVRKQVCCHLPRLLRDLATKLRSPLLGKKIVLMNAIQYQASLQSIMRDFEGKLRSGVRTAVWKQIYKSGGEADFLERLNSYQPHAVILATTQVVRKNVRTTLERQHHAWPWAEIDYHPSVWGRAQPSLMANFHPARNS